LILAMRRASCSSRSFDGVFMRNAETGIGGGRLPGELASHAELGLEGVEVFGRTSPPPFPFRWRFGADIGRVRRVVGDNKVDESHGRSRLL
jgi:hypothetical protein